MLECGGLYEFLVAARDTAVAVRIDSLHIASYSFILCLNRFPVLLICLVDERRNGFLEVTNPSKY
jgi:hypothetical protein